MKATVAGFTVLVCLFTASTTTAQQPRTATVFVNANIGVQEGAQSLSFAVPTEVFGSDGTINVDDDVIGGAVLDLSGGVRSGRVAFGVGFSSSRTDGSHDFTASTTPFSPGSFTRSINGVTPSLEHDERVFYAFAGLVKSVSDRFDVMVSGGPAFFRVRQGMPTSISVSEFPPRVEQITTDTVEESAIGFLATLDLDYMFHPRIGIGGLVRYSWGSAELPDSTDKMTLGGIHIGTGVRVRL